ncbi:MAG TPA: hypothetical protein VHB77_07035 [Planctomycetaceae bacterium]|nr:hypothetical protein [Planctomycetaceae bacterium]
MFRSSWLAGAVWLAITTVSVAAERYTLETGTNGSTRSQAVVDDDRIVITDTQGQRFTYERSANADNDDGSMLAYYSRQAGQYLRWPANNTGRMEIGTPTKAGVSWRPSQMQIRGDRVVANKPAIGPAPGELGPAPAAARRLAVLTSDKQQTIAYIDETGSLHFFTGQGLRWEHVAGAVPAGTLVPNAPLAVVPEIGATLPRVLTVGAQGTLLEISRGRQVRPWTLPQDAQLQPESAVAAAGDAKGAQAVVVDTLGRVWLCDDKGTRELVEREEGRYAPGAGVAVDGPAVNEIYLVDRAGNLVGYSRDPVKGWSSAELIAQGFDSGASIGVWRLKYRGEIAPQTHLAVVDRQGVLQHFWADPNWHSEPIGNRRFSSGAPTSAVQVRTVASVSLVSPEGRWLEYHSAGNSWSERTVADGFPNRDPLVLQYGPTGFAFDLTGRLVVANLVNGTWKASVLSADQTQAVGVDQRQQVAGAALPGVTVEFVNPTATPLVVRVSDLRTPENVRDIRLAPFGSVSVNVERRTGGILQEKRLVAGPGGKLVETVRNVTAPAQPMYDVAVFANRITYKYIDRRPKHGPVPDFEQGSLTAIGDFVLPPGEMLRDGMRIDAPRSAAMHRATPSIPPVSP